MLKRTVHVISYLWVRAWEKSGVWHNVDKISDHLYLCSMPMRGNEENLKKDVGVQDGQSMLVVSVVEDYEINKTLPFMDPTRPAEWKDSFNTNHDQIKMRDFSGGREINIQSAAEEVLKIQQHRLTGQSVLVHCKAGRTRSAMLVACVLALFDLAKLPENLNKTSRALIDDAVKFIQAQRPQVHLHEENKETAVKIINIARRILRGEAKHDESPKIKIDRLLASQPLTDVIIEMDSFKKLLKYRNDAIQEVGEFFSKLKPVKRVSHLDGIVGPILDKSDAKSSDWFAYLILYSGPVKAFINANPYFVRDPGADRRARERLIEAFRNDVVNLVSLNAGCSIAEIEALYAPEVKPMLVPT